MALDDVINRINQCTEASCTVHRPIQRKMALLRHLMAAFAPYRHMHACARGRVYLSPEMSHSENATVIS